jgi:hypothetical protein
VVYTQLFGQDNIIINSERVARDILENRSQNYSDRPEIATNELYEYSNFQVFLLPSIESLDLASTTLPPLCDTVADGGFSAKFFTSPSDKMQSPIFSPYK